ncbi:hypothetical protein A7X67_04430 [Clostridium sp. W14A]|nr:hypothetical protein A7X67_04430 [Clostridium sp. W14A]
MNKDTFWEIIDEVNSEVDHNDHKAILNTTERKLMELSPSDIVLWHNIKDVYMDLAYRNDLWAACAATNSHSTDDGFIDFRSWLISRGKEIYMGALNDPDSLAGVDFSEGTADFELYGYVASYAYTKKMALEQEGLKSILIGYKAWLTEHSAEISEFYDRNPLKKADRDQRITNAYIEFLSRKYDLYKVIDKQTLSQKAIAEIKTEMKERPDIAPDWDISDLPKLLPRLYAKYGEPPVMEVESHSEKIAQAEQKFNKKLASFSIEQAGLIRGIVDKIVSDAVAGAEPSPDEYDEQLYCEIDYNEIESLFSPLDEMGVSLTMEKLTDFLDAHPAVDYSDFHNTGVTVYLNSPEILRSLGLCPNEGGMDMQL